MPLGSRWIELVLQENAPTDLAGDPTRYQVTSTDDPQFAAPVQPIAAEQRHFPEDAWYAETHDAPTVATIHVTYRVFLELDRPLNDGKHYAVAVDPTAITDPGPWPFVMGAEPSEALHVNQVAYLADGPKVAYLSAWTGQRGVDFPEATDFELVDEATGQAVLSGPVVLDNANDPWSGSLVYSLDFSARSPSR